MRPLSLPSDRKAPSVPRGLICPCGQKMQALAGSSEYLTGTTWSCSRVSPGIRWIFAPLRQTAISNAYNVLTSEFEASRTCVDTNTWRCTAPEWGSGSREFKSHRPDQLPASNPSFPDTYDRAALRRTLPLSAESVRSAHYVLIFGWPRSSWLLTSIGSFPLRSNRRANVGCR